MCNLERPFCTWQRLFVQRAPLPLRKCASRENRAQRPWPRCHPVPPVRSAYASCPPSGRPAVAALTGRCFHERASARSARSALVSRASSPDVQNGCAKGTSQIAHRNGHSAFVLFFYVQFGTSLLHITRAFRAGTAPAWRGPTRSARRSRSHSAAAPPHKLAAGCQRGTVRAVR